VVGAKLADLTPPEELTQILANIRRLGPDSPVAAYDHRVPLPDGTERWQEWIDQALFAPDGRTVVAYQSTGRDITARKLAEERLRRSEQRLQLALAAGSQGVWEYDVETSEVRRDPVLARRLGRAPGEMGGLAHWAERLHPDDRERVLAELDSLVRADSERFAAEYRLRRDDGGYIWVLNHAVAVERGADGLARRVVGTSADVDGTHRADERLKDSEQRLRLALEAAALAIWEVDLRAGGVLRVDATGAERLGRGRAPLELPLASLRDLLPCRDDRRELLRRYRAHVEGRAERFLTEARTRRADGSSYWVEVYGIVTERDVAGRPLRLIGVTADVTRRKEAELRLAPPGAAGPPHRPAEPPRAGREPRAGDRAGAPWGRVARPDAAGPGRLQAGERPARPPRGRQGAVRGGAAPPAVRAAQRRGGPLRRRRVRRRGLPGSASAAASSGWPSASSRC
jgi:PAS domain S-box-containing protein